MQLVGVVGPLVLDRNTHTHTLSHRRACTELQSLRKVRLMFDDGLSAPPWMSSGLVHWFILQIFYQHFLPKMFPLVFVYISYIFYRRIGSCCLTELVNFNRFWCLMMLFSNLQYKYLFAGLNWIFFFFFVHLQMSISVKPSSQSNVLYRTFALIVLWKVFITKKRVFINFASLQLGRCPSDPPGRSPVSGCSAARSPTPSLRPWETWTSH